MLENCAAICVCLISCVLSHLKRMLGDTTEQTILNVIVYGTVDMIVVFVYCGLERNVLL